MRHHQTVVYVTCKFFRDFEIGDFCDLIRYWGDSSLSSSGYSRYLLNVFDIWVLEFAIWYILYFMLTRASHIMRITATPLNRCVVHATSITYNFEIRILKWFSSLLGNLSLLEDRYSRYMFNIISIFRVMMVNDICRYIYSIFLC